MKFHYLSFLIASSLIGCQPKLIEKDEAAKEVVWTYLEKGHEIYRSKNDANTFANSMLYFDTAVHLAEEINDTGLLGYAYFSKGSVYDAWNRDKDKTIEYFIKAYKTLDLLQTKEYANNKLYIHHLIAHAYEKKGDSTMAVQYILKNLQLINIEPDSIQRRAKYVPQLALIATMVHNYRLADDILRNNCNKITIKNDPNSYNYLDNSYLTRARIDIYGYKKKHSPYIDSFYQCYARTKTPVDSFEILEKIFPLYLAVENKEMGYKTMRDYIALHQKQNSVDILLHAQNQLNQTEINLRKSENENLKMTNWIYVISLISLASIIGGGSFFILRLMKEKKKLSESLLKNELLRDDLEKQNQTNLLLNKEIHHRIKNNLQFIHSIIDMQINHSQSMDVKKELEDTQFRIRSVSNSYDMMRKEVEINLRDGLNQFLNEILQNFKNHKSIQWICNIENIQLNAKYTIPIFVILNELITNTIKHCQANDLITAQIDINYSNEQLTLNYKDQNKIIDSVKKEAGLGMEIIELLVLQLKGTMSRTDNYEYQIIFPYKMNNIHLND